MHVAIGMLLVVYGIHYRLFQVFCLKQNTHVNKITNQLPYFSAAAIFLSREYLYFRTTNLKRMVPIIEDFHRVI